MWRRPYDAALRLGVWNASFHAWDFPSCPAWKLHQLMVNRPTAANLRVYLPQVVSSRSTATTRSVHSPGPALGHSSTKGTSLFIRVPEELSGRPDCVSGDASRVDRGDPGPRVQAR